jgi:hypothetical protein
MGPVISAKERFLANFRVARNRSWDLSGGNEACGAVFYTRGPLVGEACEMAVRKHAGTKPADQAQPLGAIDSRDDDDWRGQLGAA